MSLKAKPMATEATPSPARIAGIQFHQRYGQGEQPAERDDDPTDEPAQNAA